MNTRTTSKILALALTTLAACAADGGLDGTGDGGGDGSGDGSGGGGGGGGGSVTATQVLQAIDRLDCDQAFACRSTYPADSGKPFADVFGADANACYAASTQHTDAAAIEASITAGRIEFNASSASSCMSALAALAAPACATFWDQVTELPAACNMLLVGKVATGGACTIDDDCEGKSACGAANTCETAPTDK